MRNARPHTILALGAAAAVSLGAASPAGAATATVPVPDAADLTLSFTHVKATKRAPGKAKRPRAPRVVLKNRAALPRELRVYQGVVRRKGKPREFDVMILQMRPGIALPAAASPPLGFEIGGKNSRRYRISGRQRIFKNFSEEASAASLAKIPLRIAPTSTGARASQIDVGALIRAIVCPILNQLANGPLGQFIGPLLNSLRAVFGCIDPNAAPPFADVAAQNGLKGGTPPPPPPPDPGTPTPTPTPGPGATKTCNLSVAFVNPPNTYEVGANCSEPYSQITIDPPGDRHIQSADHFGHPPCTIAPDGLTATCARDGGYTNNVFRVELVSNGSSAPGPWTLTTRFQDGTTFTGTHPEPPAP